MAKYFQAEYKNILKEFFRFTSDTFPRIGSFKSLTVVFTFCFISFYFMLENILKNKIILILCLLKHSKTKATLQTQQFYIYTEKLWLNLNKALNKE